VKAVPAAWLFREVMDRFAAFATAHLQGQGRCPRGDSFKAHFERLLIRTPLNRFYTKCVAGGGCFGRSRPAPCGGPGEFHYPYSSARERAEAQRWVMAAAAAFLAAAEKIMALHADAPKETFAAALAEFDAHLTPALREKAAAIRDLYRV